ncbi:hypothetical protein GCM10020218_046720 [Dactylosporangium vinaceum]
MGMRRPPALLRDPVLLGMGALAVAMVGWYLAGPGGSVLSWAIQTGLDVCVIVFSRRLHALNAGDRPARRFWRGLTVVGAMCATGDGLQTVLVARGGPGTPISLVQTSLVVCSMTVVVIIMLRHPLGDTGRLRLRLWLDAATVLAGVAVLLWYFALGAHLDSPRIADRVLFAAMSVVMLVVVLGVLKLILSGTAPFTRLAGVAGCIGVAGTALGSAATIIIIGSNPRVETVASLLSCLLVVASLRMQEVQLRQPGEHARAPRRRTSVMPYLAWTVTELLLMFALGATGADPRLWGVAAGVLLITLLVVTRQLVAFHDNNRLLTSLDRSNAELRQLHEELRHRATHDTLTGLANRALLAEHMAALPPDGGVSILVLDLDGFKQVNDHYGHHAGDALLVAAARRLAAGIGERDLAVRLGGDEFAVVLPGSTPAAARRLAVRLAEALSEPYDGALVGASIGVASGAPSALDALLRDADADMYRIKTARKAAAVVA